MRPLTDTMKDADGDFSSVNHAVDRVFMLVLRRAGSLMGMARRCREASGPRDEGLIWLV